MDFIIPWAGEFTVWMTVQLMPLRFYSRIVESALQNKGTKQTEFSQLLIKLIN